jgi:hypothetical protein
MIEIDIINKLCGYNSKGPQKPQPLSVTPHYKSKIFKHQSLNENSHENPNIK